MHDDNRASGVNHQATIAPLWAISFFVGALNVKAPNFSIERRLLLLRLEFVWGFGGNGGL